MLCDYFTAASDAQAEETIAWIGGPANPFPGPEPCPREPGRRTPGREPSAYRAGDADGKLQEALTGRSVDDVLRDPAGKTIA